MRDVGAHYDTQARANWKAFSEFHGRCNDGDSAGIMGKPGVEATWLSSHSISETVLPRDFFHFLI